MVMSFAGACEQCLRFSFSWFLPVVVVIIIIMLIMLAVVLITIVIIMYFFLRHHCLVCIFTVMHELKSKWMQTPQFYCYLTWIQCHPISSVYSIVWAVSWIKSTMMCLFCGDFPNHYSFCFFSPLNMIFLLFKWSGDNEKDGRREQPRIRVRVSGSTCRRVPPPLNHIQNSHSCDLSN